jgi:hypothetical protein
MNKYIRHKVFPNGFPGQISKDQKYYYIQAVGRTEKGIRFGLLLTISKELIIDQDIKLDDYVSNVVVNYDPKDIMGEI